MKRIAMGMIVQESNTFSPIPTTLKDFEDQGLCYGREVLDRYGQKNELGGFVAAARSEKDVELVPTLRAWAWAGGRVEQPTFNYLKDELLNRVKDAGSINEVLLALHGSMVTGELDDPEGELLSALRQHLGQIPVVAPFDLHANMTALKVKLLTALVGYHTSPHTDLFETGLKAGRILFSTIRGKVRPRNHKAISFSVGGLQILCYGLEMTVIALRLRCPCSGPSGFEPLSCGSILSSSLSLVSR